MSHPWYKTEAVKPTDDVTQGKQKSKKSLNNSLTLPQADKAKKTFQRFLHCANC